jgi:hypothetical protein
VQTIAGDRAKWSARARDAGRGIDSAHGASLLPTDEFWGHLMSGNQLSRRGLLAAAGAVGGAALLGPAAVARATPRPVPPNAATAARPDSPPSGLPTPIASAPVPGVSYQFRDHYQFVPETFAEGRAWSIAGGMFPDLAPGGMAVGFDLPPGAQLYDVEWYMHNGSTTSVDALLRIWVAGAAQIIFGGVDTTIPPGSTVTATRVLVPAASNGPFPHGCRALAYTHLPSDGSAVVNGVRVGYLHAPTAPALLPSPVRVYDSRSQDGPLAAGHARVISLGSHLPPGAVGAIVNLTVTQTVGHGFLTLYPTGVPRPSTSSINWFASGQTLANQATTAVGAGNEVTVYAGGNATQFVVDLLAYLA